MQSLPPERQAALDGAMRRALDLARRGPQHNVNPRVGCVLLSPDDRIVAEGWHRGAGTPHAETDALAQLPEGWRARARELTAVVTLEPCNHTGFTGPCTEALLSAGIGRVVFATRDPGVDSGGGADYLREHGVEVIEGVREDEAKILLAGWLAARHRPRARHGKGGRPRVIAKWAQTLDGRVAADDGSSRWITGAEARAHVHAERAQADGILIGTGTLLADDPSLTARDPDGNLLVEADNQPIPIVCGKRNIPRTLRMFEHPALAAKRLDAPIQIDGADLPQDLRTLKERGIQRLYVEGGPTLVSSLLRAHLVDELHVYLAPKLLGGRYVAIDDLGISHISGALHLAITGTTRLGNDLLITATPTVPERSA